MKCDMCGSTAIRLVDGEWYDRTAREKYECELCGTRATYYLDKDGQSMMVGSISTDL